MPGESLQNRTETREQTPLQRWVEHYQQTYNRLLQEERVKSGDQLRSALDQFRQANNLPKLTDIQKQNETLLRQLMVFSRDELKPVRAQIVEEIMKKITDNPNETDAVLGNLFSTMQEAPVPDLLLLDELLRKSYEEAIKNRIKVIQEKTPAEVQDGFNAIENPTRENLEKLGNAPSPQELSFDLYLLNLWSLRKHPEVLREIIKPENKNLDAFARLTLTTYQAFLKEQGLPPDTYGPNLEWYTKLARKAGVEQQLRTLQILNYPVITAFNRRMQEQAAILEEQAQRLPEGSPERIALMNQARGLRDLRQEIQQNTPIIPGANRIQSVGTVFGFDPFGHISRGMDWIGSKLPTPEGIRDMTVDDLGGTAVKAWLGAIALLNLAGPVVGIYNVAGKMVGQMAQYKFSDAIRTIPEFLNPIKNNIMGIGTAAVATYFVARGTQDIEGFVGEGWERATSKLGEIGRQMKERAAPYLNRGPEGFRAYLSANFQEYYADLRTGDGKRWEAVKEWPGMTPEKVQEIRNHFQAMVSVQREMDLYYTSLDVSRTVSISISAFNQFLARYIEGNEDLGAPQLKDIQTSELKDMGYLTQEQIALLPSNTPPFKPSEALARQLIQQGVWLKNNPNTL